MIRVLMLVFLYSFLTYAQFVPMSIDTKKPKKYISSVDKMQLKPKYSDTNTKNGIKWSKEMIIVIKTGDLPPYYHNQVVSIIDSSTYRQLPDSLSLWMRTVYRMETHELKDRAKFREAIDSNIVWMADSTGNNNRYLMDDSYVELATIKNKYKEKNQPVDILKATKYKAKDYLILDTDVTDNDPVVDSNAITAGTYTVGPTGDYAGLEAANADVGSGTLTDTLRLVTNGAFTIPNTVTFTYTSGGFPLIWTSNKFHYGNPDSGHIITFQKEVRDDHSGIGGMYVEWQNCIGSTNTQYFFVPQNNNPGGHMTIRWCIADGNDTFRYFVITGNSNASVHAYGNKAFELQYGVSFQTGLFCRVANNLFSDISINGFWHLNADSAHVENNVFYDCVNDLAGTNIDKSIFRNNATNKTGAFGAGVESGTVDQITSADFLSVNIADSNGFDIDATSQLYRAGTDPILVSEITQGIDGDPWESGAYDIGPYAVATTVYSVDSISPDSTNFEGGCDTITLSTQNSGSSRGSGFILFADSNYTDVVSWSDTDIKIFNMTYADTISDTIKFVNNDGDTSTGVPFKFIDARPVIDSVKSYTTQLDIAITSTYNDTVFLACSTNSELVFVDTLPLTPGNTDTVTITGLCYGQSIIIHANNRCGQRRDTINTLSYVGWNPTFLRSSAAATTISVPFLANKNDSCFKFYRGSTISNSGTIAKTISSGGDTSDISISTINKLVTFSNSGIWYLKLTAVDMTQSDPTIILKVYGDEVDTTEYLRINIQ